MSIKSNWTYLSSDGLVAPPEDGDSGFSVPVVAWFTDTPEDIESGERTVVVARLTERVPMASLQRGAIDWCDFEPSGDYRPFNGNTGHPYCWIVRPMSKPEREAASDG